MHYILKATATKKTQKATWGGHEDNVTNRYTKLTDQEVKYYLTAQNWRSS